MIVALARERVIVGANIVTQKVKWKTGISAKWSSPAASKGFPTSANQTEKNTANPFLVVKGYGSLKASICKQS